MHRSVRYPAVRHRGIVVASHCTNGSLKVGQEDEVDIHQPTNPIFGSNKVAEGTTAPGLTRLPGCPAFHKCRYSDAAFAATESNVSIDQAGKLLEFLYLRVLT